MLCLDAQERWRRLVSLRLKLCRKYHAKRQILEPLFSMFFERLRVPMAWSVWWIGVLP